MTTYKNWLPIYNSMPQKKDIKRLTNLLHAIAMAEARHDMFPHDNWLHVKNRLAQWYNERVRSMMVVPIDYSIMLDDERKDGTDEDSAYWRSVDEKITERKERRVFGE